MQDVCVADLPHELAACEQLRALTVTRGQLTACPPVAAHLPKLARLDLSHNLLSHLPGLRPTCLSRAPDVSLARGGGARRISPAVAG